MQELFDGATIMESQWLEDWPFVQIQLYAAESPLFSCSCGQQEAILP